MSKLFEPVSIGKLSLRNRIMRSATAERMADPETGSPLASLRELYIDLAQGGVGLIVTGHVYVMRSGKAHSEMAAFDRDDLVSAWRDAISPAQELGAKMVVQINHGGASCHPDVTPDAKSPAGVATNDLNTSPGVMTEADIVETARAYGQTARRAREAGFDGVQIHGAHGYLISQFLTPALNTRSDAWGGDGERRLAFLRRVISEIRQQVGPTFPVWIKLGVAGQEASGQTIELGMQAVAACQEAGVDAIELSHGWNQPAWAKDAESPQFLPMAVAARQVVGPDYPLALVNGFRSLDVMERTLASGLTDLISMCRPLIVEPDLPNKLRDGVSVEAKCASCSQCWPNTLGEGIACHNASVQRRMAAMA